MNSKFWNSNHKPFYQFKCAATNKTKTSQQGSAVMYYFLNVQRDSANQYKCSKISWLMLENRRGTEPRCFKILYWDIEQSLWWWDGFSLRLMGTKQTSSQPPSWAFGSREPAAKSVLFIQNIQNSQLTKYTKHRKGRNSSAGAVPQNWQLYILVCKEDTFVFLVATCYCRTGWQRGIKGK